MKKAIGNISRFSLSEMTSNSDGKTSASGTMAVFIILVGGVTFLIGALGMIFKATDSNILVQSIAMVYAGALLLGYRKSKDSGVEVQEIEAQADVKVAAECTCPDGCKCGNCERCK